MNLMYYNALGFSRPNVAKKKKICTHLLISYIMVSLRNDFLATRETCIDVINNRSHFLLQ